MLDLQSKANLTGLEDLSGFVGSMGTAVGAFQLFV